MGEPPNHSGFQTEIYLAGMNGTLPELPFTYPEWEAAAIEQMDDRAVGYVAGGAGLERTMSANTRAFDRWQFVPRMMRDISHRDTRIELFGHTYPSPILVAPVGVQSIIHDQAELATARAAAGLDVPFIASTASSFPMEEIAEVSGDAPRWFQLYWPSDRNVALSLVERAMRRGYTAVVVTLDTKELAWRPRDLMTAYLPFIHQVGVANWFNDPEFLKLLDEPVEDNPIAAILQWVATFKSTALTWDDLDWLRHQTSLPILVKGIQHPADAKLAVQHGADGIVVSNHGGRQIDGAIGALTALAPCVDAVGPDVPVLFDSGVRSGADVAKAVALGARAVLVGRPWCWGLGLDGEAGVRHVLRSLLAEYELTLGLLGLTRTSELDSGVLIRDGDAPVA